MLGIRYQNDAFLLSYMYLFENVYICMYIYIYIYIEKRKLALFESYPDRRQIEIFVENKLKLKTNVMESVGKNSPKSNEE